MVEALWKGPKITRSEKSSDYFPAAAPIAIKQEVNEMTADVYYGRGSKQAGYRKSWKNGGASASWQRNKQGGTQGTARAGGQYGQADLNQIYKDRAKLFNPMMKNGLIKRCNNCESLMHLYGDCPHPKLPSVLMAELDLNSDDDDSQEVLYAQYQYGPPQPPRESRIYEVSLFEGKSDFYVYQTLMDNDRSAIVDTACSKTVCGKRWLQEYVDSLSEHDRSTVFSEPSQNKFKFGAGGTIPSGGSYVIPIYLDGERHRLRVEVVESELPLLLSLGSMKDMGGVLDLPRGKATFFGKEFTLNYTSSGHYSLNIAPDPVYRVENILKVDLGDTDEAIRGNLLKLHHQLGHLSADSLASMIKSTKNTWKPKYKKILDEISTDCLTCKLYRREKPRPVVSVALADEFNEVLTIDLKKDDDGGWICYFIDAFSRMSQGYPIPRKTPECVIEAFMLGWIAPGYGRPKCFFIDLGGEFNNEELYSMTSIMGIKVITTASGCPYSNGICERNHQTVDHIVQKLKVDHKDMPKRVLLAWACCIKNSMAMFNGYSSYQIVFGRNPPLPGDEECSGVGSLSEPSSEVFRKHLQIINDAKKAFVDGQNSEKIKRALAHRVRITDHPLRHGDVVFYKRPNEDRWLGPATVEFQTSSLVFLRHGGFIVRCARNRVVLKDREYERKNATVFD